MNGRFTTAQPGVGSVLLSNVSAWRSGQWILRDVGFEVPEGSLVVLAGPNGAGKTTLLRWLAGALLRHDGWLISGRLTWRNGQGVSPAQVSYLGQSMSASAELTVREFLSLSEHVNADMVERFELTGLGEIPLTGLSGGQWQRVRLAQCLSRNSSLVLLDEPETYLDRRWRRVLLEILSERCAKGNIVVISHHRPQELQDLASHWLGLKEGGVMFFEDQAGVFPASLMSGLFLGKVLDSP
ncbi:MAG: ABC transporter ATP-binding protein [Silvanigrellaceae bacterium]